MSVRPATVDDVAAISALERDCLGADAWSEALVLAGVTGDLPTVSYLVAEHDEPGDPVVVGHAVASLAGDVAELQRIAVAAAYRRGGLASALLGAVVALAAEGGADRLLLEVRQDNAGALAFYAAAGFTEIDRRRRYYRDGATAVVLVRELDGDREGGGGWPA